MVYFKIGIQDFITEENFRKLQEKFTRLDDQAGPEFILEKVVESNKLTASFIDADIFGLNQHTVKIDFLKDFLFIEIPKIGGYYLHLFLGELKKQYTAESKNGLALELINRIRKAKNDIANAKYLDGVIKNHLAYQLDYIEDGLESYLQNAYPQIKQKVQFNWNRTDVEYFFHLLRINKQIASISERDLGRFIDNTIECLDSKTGKYNEIKGSHKHLNDFYNAQGRPHNLAIERLSKIFTNPDFYNI